MPVTQHNYKPKPVERQHRKPITIPGQVTTIKAIYERFRRGQGVETFLAGYNPDIPANFDNLDRFERLDAVRELKQNIAKQREILQQQREDERRKVASGSPKPEAKSSPTTEEAPSN